MIFDEMKNNHPEISQLLAYVDGELDAQEHQRIKYLIDNDVKAKEIVEQFAKSNLPYKDAFHHLLEQSMWAKKQDQKMTQSRWRSWGALAASLLMGVVIGLYATHYSTQQKSWVQQVVDYQVLYGRKTVENVSLSELEQQQLEVKFGKILGRSFKVPQLKEYGLSFKRGQVLTLDNLPLIQLVYLPEQGKPVALCIINLNLPDSDFSLKSTASLPSIEWSKDKLSYVMVGDIKHTILRQAAKQVRSIGVF